MRVERGGLRGFLWFEVCPVLSLLCLEFIRVRLFLCRGVIRTSWRGNR